MIPVRILGIHADPQTGASIVLLGEIDEVTRVVPIIVGPTEANAIAVGLGGITMPRPMTHDLMVEVMRVTGVALRQVHVTELRESTFFAELELETSSGRQRVSSRPSDGIALAVRFGVGISIDDDVFRNAAVQIEHDVDEPFDEVAVEEIVAEFNDFLATARPADFAEPPADESDPGGESGPQEPSP